MSAIEPGCNFGEGIVICGPGGILIRDQWSCPECKNETARLLVRWPSSLYYGNDLLCECGDQFSEGERFQRPFTRGWRAAAQARFEKDWETALPDGSQPNYDYDGGAMLESVTLPDGSLVTR